MRIEIHDDVVVFYASDGTQFMRMNIWEATRIIESLGGDATREDVIEKLLSSRNGVFSVEKS